MDISVIHSFRRGTGKTTIAANVATILAQNGFRVGLVDVNFPSPSLNILFGVTPAEMPDTLNDYLWGNCRIEDAVYDLTPRLRLATEMPGHIYLLPASSEYHAIARMIRGGYYVELLGNALQELEERLELDFLLIDTPAGLDEETLFTMSRADRLFVVLRPDQQDYLGTSVIAEIATRLGLAHTLLIVNEVPHLMDIKAVRAKVEESFEHPVVAVMEHADELLALASSGIFVLHHPRHRVTQELRDLAQRFVVPASQ